MKSISNKTKGDNSKSTRKKARVVILVCVRKPELLFLYATHLLALFYISTKYHQNIPKGIQVTEGTRSFTLMPMSMPTGSVPKIICPPTLWCVCVCEGGG